MIFALASIAFSILAYVFIYKRAIKQAEYYVSATREVESEKNRDKYEEDIMKIFELSKENRVKLEGLPVFDRKDLIRMANMYGVKNVY